MGKMMMDSLNSTLNNSGSKDTLNSFALLFDEVNDEAAKQIIQWVIECNFQEDGPTILNLLINSPGGDLHSAFAIIDVMKSSKVPIRTIGLGQISSAGLMVFMAGTKGQRVLTPNTSIMSHAWSGGAIGKSHELFAASKEFVLTNERMIEHYVSCTGLSEKMILKYLLPSQDVYLSANDALKYKLCDQVAELS